MKRADQKNGDQKNWSSLSMWPVLLFFHPMLWLRECTLNPGSASSCSLTCGVVLQYRVFTEGLEPPGDQDILRVGWSRVVAAQDDGGEQSRSPLRLWNNHLDGQQLWHEQEGWSDGTEDKREKSSTPDTLFKRLIGIDTTTCLCLCDGWIDKNLNRLANSLLQKSLREHTMHTVITGNNSCQSQLCAVKTSRWQTTSATSEKNQAKRSKHFLLDIVSKTLSEIVSNWPTSVGFSLRNMTINSACN